MNSNISSINNAETNLGTLHEYLDSNQNFNSSINSQKRNVVHIGNLV